eukprot:NODE_16853_length_974_cov_2.902007.p3 GENE.NODE_16853_length_974_cov_2.902007~~NODE_16853_length_974_cov_2.902007.p3  ORF type:complete len:77 (+),score=11.65 NODE_16853_length_974_cov_2.902007:742-972(+)
MAVLASPLAPPVCMPSTLLLPLDAAFSEVLHAQNPRSIGHPNDVCCNTVPGSHWHPPPSAFGMCSKGRCSDPCTLR